MFFYNALLACAAAAPLVAAHGSLKFAKVDGKLYRGPIPGAGESGDFAIRAVDSVDPVKGAASADMNCGRGATASATISSPANPGSVLEFAWQNGELGTWVHDRGPVLTYMAPCGAGGCASFDSSQAKFFKIDQKGMKQDGTWFLGDLTAGPDATTSVTLPSNLPAGEYLVRHELIGLQVAENQGGAEFFPVCMQIALSEPTATPQLTPTGDQVTSFPGGYSDSDPGILVNVFGGIQPDQYVFPGPAPITDASGPGNPAPAPSPSPSAAPSPSPSDPSEVPEPSETEGDSGIAARSAEHKKRASHVVRSRVMRGVDFDA